MGSLPDIGRPGDTGLYILMGKQPWFDADDKEEFAKAARMRDIMRQCELSGI